MSRRLYLRLGLPVLCEISTGSSATTFSGSAFAASCRVWYTRVARLRAIRTSPTLSRTSRCIPFARYRISTCHLAEKGGATEAAPPKCRLGRAGIPVDVRPHNRRIATLLPVDETLDQERDAVGLPHADHRARAGRSRAVHGRGVVHEERRLIRHRHLNAALVAEEDLVALDQRHDRAVRVDRHVLRR